MCDELQKVPFGERELPRWVQIPAGLILLLLSAICAFAVVGLFLFAPKPKSMLGLLVDILLLLPCLWALQKSLRVVTGRRIGPSGGLLGPTALRIVAYSLPLIAISGLFTGYYREHPLAIFQGLLYLSGFFGLRALAREREQKVKQSPRAEPLGSTLRSAASEKDRDRSRDWIP